MGCFAKLFKRPFVHLRKTLSFRLPQSLEWNKVQPIQNSASPLPNTTKPFKEALLTAKHFNIGKHFFFEMG